MKPARLDITLSWKVPKISGLFRIAIVGNAGATVRYVLPDGTLSAAEVNFLGSENFDAVVGETVCVTLDFAAYGGLFGTTGIEIYPVNNFPIRGTLTLAEGDSAII